MSENKKPKSQSVLSNFNPLDLEKQAKFNDINSQEYKNLKEWYDRKLIELWYLALGREELKEAFLATAERLNEKTKLRSKTGKIWLLEHFALLKNQGNTHEEILTELIKWNQEIRHKCLSKRTIENLISESIKEVDLDDLPEWAHDAIKKRRELGKKLHNK